MASIECGLLVWATRNRVMINPTPTGGFNATIGTQTVWALTIAMALRALRHATRPTQREMREWWSANEVYVYSTKLGDFCAARDGSLGETERSKTVMGALRKLRRRIEGSK